MTLFDIASLEEELHTLEKQTEEPSFWVESQNSSRILKRINELKNKTENYKKISSTFEYIEDLNE
ncbi:MAG: peptide chain release factor 2, partial [Clostridia bacterium]